ncbi:hypothetical protein K5Q02_11390 [Pseudomonas sp. MM211]|uniref:hypothetical protein n=1 Tax=Pseudomonas sp. MM211 TaxID=2866808 RepID=UPI001CED9013|nr:hypothetical protein [Pseudomonas sp. MM211]UCJ18920.1 hypothetical protein K5Q02_11390 [Pseudomonas sp. MM211]
MSKITHEFNQAELDHRITNEREFYLARESVSHAPHEGARVLVSGDYPGALITNVIEKVSEGYTFLPETVNASSGYSFAMMFKPSSEQEADIKLLSDRITAEYNAERKSLYDAHVAKVVSESLDRERRSAEKKQAEAEAKLREKLEAQALAALGAFE